jgi:Zn-dependent protease/CBS domain-containing protein
MPGSLHLGKVFGVNIDINYSWLVLLVFLTFSLAVGWFPVIYHGWAAAVYWIVALIAALLLFVSVLVHELAHSLVARAHGVPVSSITLFIFGGVSNIEREPPSAGTEFWIAVVGPLASIVIGAISWLLAAVLLPLNVYIGATLGYLGVANLLLGVFNLIPGFPLDGGRVLRAIIWGASGSLKTATTWATRIGQVVAYLFIIWGIFQLFTGNFLGGLWIAFIGWFLLSGAQAANSQVQLQYLLKGVMVADVMSRTPQTVPSDLTIEQFVEDYALSQGIRTALVMEGRQLRGLIALADLRHVPRSRWGQEPVAQAMVPLDRVHAVAPGQSLNDVLPILAQHDLNQVPVVQDGQVVGVLSRDRIMQYIEVRRELGGRSGQRPPQSKLPPSQPSGPETYPRGTAPA